MRRLRTIAILPAIVAISVAGCTSNSPSERAMSIDGIAEEYVKLVLALGQHDADYVDAYLGPEEWKAEAEERSPSVEEVGASAGKLLVALQGIEAAEAGEDAGLEASRRRALERTIESLIARTRMLSGEEMSFDEESLALYDAQAPVRSADEFEDVLDELAEALPGEGSISDRLNEFKKAFIIPSEKLDEVFRTAVDACREKTIARMELPAEESFVIEYVTDKSWSGYNWYKGGYHSLIQVNTDLPIYIDRALDLACHEGYPGHHVYNVLIERELVNARGWSEYLVYPLFSPRSLIAEGSANYGIEVAFPGDERIEFERDVLFPLAGLDVGRVEEFYDVQRLAAKLAYAGNEAARGYLDGTMTREESVAWLTNYSLSSRARAEQRLRFIEQYRSYVINYNLGLDMVRDSIEARGGTADDPDTRWKLFAELLMSPTLPSDLGAV